MVKYITQEEVFKILTDLNDPLNAKVRTTEAMRLINALPSADVKPVVRGKWIFEEYEFASWCTKAICSSCKKTIANNSDLAHDWGQKLFLHDYQFCPKCGADMRGLNNGKD